MCRKIRVTVVILIHLFLGVGCQNRAMAEDSLIARDGTISGGGEERARYEKAIGKAAVVGLRPLANGDRHSNTTVSIEGEAAALVYNRLDIIEEERTGVVYEGQYFVKGGDLTCTKTVLFEIEGRKASIDYACGLVVTNTGKVKTTRTQFEQ